MYLPFCTHTYTSQQVYPFFKPSKYFSNLSKKKKYFSNTLARRTSHGDGVLSPLTCCFGLSLVFLFSVTQILHNGGEKTQPTTHSWRRLADNRPPPLIKGRIRTKIQRDPKVWPDPNEFRPERFLTTHKSINVRELEVRILS